MFETTVKAFIDLPVPFVYEYLRKMENQIHFNSSIQSVEKLSDQSYKIKIDLGIMTLNETYTIVKEEPQVFFEAECKSNGMNFKDRYQTLLRKWGNPNHHHRPNGIKRAFPVERIFGQNES